MTIPLNTQLAMKLQEMADLLEQQGANPFRVKAYRHAAVTLIGLECQVSDILDREGVKGLIALPDIGKGIANALLEMVSTGRWAQLLRLRGTLDPEQLFQTVPGIGPGLAKRIHDELHVDTLEGLEAAAYDGSLLRVRGIGGRRLPALQAALSSMLGRAGQRRDSPEGDVPPVALLLAVDRHYLEQAESNKLPRIAPRRFNPEGDAWLPILHIELEGWHFTVMFSNTARAHQLRQTRDWVVIYFYDDHHQEGQQTLVTETHGPLVGRRVVRGREVECGEYYF
ncbi:MAG: helix-hairpin-helix domain-containing protein [Candidatus Sedimenticola sp. (ex Thyasira tokunagai)]